MKYDADNVFAKILRGEIPCRKVYEDDCALSFYDIHPKAKVHVLVISKGLFRDYADFIGHSTDDEIADFARAIIRTAEALNLTAPGYRVVLNTGRNSGQEVPHLHAHILGGESLANRL
ncbi:MAG: HIT domain-containing protein [Alphaproteobacteria bacterium]|nr:HIT domain-containing protein [Alphaproteobacteria bacterium]